MTEDEYKENAVQVDELGRRVWVFARDGSTIARFDSRFGMDIHTTVTEQMTGASQCLYCTHEKPSAEDWDLFRHKVKEHYDIDIPKHAVEEYL